MNFKSVFCTLGFVFWYADSSPATALRASCFDYITRSVRTASRRIQYELHERSKWFNKTDTFSRFMQTSDWSGLGFEKGECDANAPHYLSSLCIAEQSNR